MEFQAAVYSVAMSLVSMGTYAKMSEHRNNTHSLVDQSDVLVINFPRGYMTSTIMNTTHKHHPSLP